MGAGDRSLQVGSPLPPPGHFGLSRPAGLTRAARPFSLSLSLSRRRRPPPRPRGARARPRSPRRPTRRASGPRQAARAGAASPHPLQSSPPPNAPPPPVGASDRALAARWLPALPAGKVAGPLWEGAAPPLRPPRGKAQPAAPLFLPDGSFRARACSLSPLARTPARSLGFLSFLLGARPRGAPFPLALLAPSFLLSPAERGGRQLSPPPCTRAPAEAAAAALRAPTHSNMARTQGACARGPPTPSPSSAVLPPGNPRPSLRARGTPDPASPSPPARGAGAARETTRPRARVHNPPLCSRPPVRTSPKDTREAVALGVAA
jgi:hypothetical protein